MSDENLQLFTQIATAWKGLPPSFPVLLPIPPPPPSTMKAAEMLPAVDALMENGASLVDALQAVPNPPELTLAALKSASHRRGAAPPGDHGNRLLTSEQEETMDGVIQAFSMNNLPLSRSQIRTMARQRFGVQVSEMWVRRYLKRNNRHVRTRTCKALADKRLGAQVVSNVNTFCSELKDFLETHHFPPSAVMNFDETRLVFKGSNLTTKRVLSAGRERPDVSSTPNSTVASLLSFVAADGSVFLSVYVLKANFGEDDRSPINFTLEPALQASLQSWPRFCCRTDTGYLNADLFGRMVDLAAAEWRVRNPGLPLLLFRDQCSAHMSTETLQRALPLNFFLFFLVENSSHFLQPLDAAPFGCFHRSLRVYNDQYVWDALMTGESMRGALLAAAYHFERRAFTPAVVKGAFKTTGLWPFDSAVVLARARESLGIADDGGSARAQAAAMASEVLSEARQRVSSGKRRESGGSTVEQRGTIHSPYNLIKAARKKAAEEAAAAEERGLTKVARIEKAAAKAKDDQAAAVRRFELTCRVCSSTRHRGGPAWLVCHCGRWRAARGANLPKPPLVPLWHTSIFVMLKGGASRCRRRGVAGLVTSCVLVLYLFWPTVGCNLCEKLQTFVAASKVK